MQKVPPGFVEESPLYKKTAEGDFVTLF